jgi:hypothetical protein
MTSIDEVSGCPTCLPPDANRAWDAVKILAQQSRPVDESHFTVVIRACPECSQHFVSVFSETVDWTDGEDPQLWSVLPISAAEMEQLLNAGSGIESRLAELAPHRRSLCHDHPKGKTARNFWSSGVIIGPHD